MLIELDYKDRRPIYEQVTEKLASMMMLGVLEENSQLPSVRSMAVALSINPNTIQRAYAELERQGYIYSVKGKGSFVTDTSKMKEFRQKEARGKVAEAARRGGPSGTGRGGNPEAAKEGIHTEVKEEIHAAVREESREAGSTGTDAGQMPLKQIWIQEGMSMINAVNVTKRFDDIVAVDHINATIRDGNVFGLIGTNGAGKSTFLRMASGVLKPDEGKYFHRWRGSI